MRSIGADPKEWPKDPFEDLEPLRHLTHLAKLQKKFMQVFIALLVGELTFQ